MVDMTNISNITSIQGIAYYSNNAVEGLLFSGGMIILFFIMIMVLARFNESPITIIAISSWSMFVLSIFFWFANLVPTVLCLVFLLLAAASTLMLYGMNP